MHQHTNVTGQESSDIRYYKPHKYLLGLGRRDWVHVGRVCVFVCGDGDCCAVSVVGLVIALDICPLSVLVYRPLRMHSRCATHICGFRVLDWHSVVCYAVLCSTLESRAFSEQIATLGGGFPTAAGAPSIDRIEWLRTRSIDHDGVGPVEKTGAIAMRCWRYWFAPSRGCHLSMAITLNRCQFS